MKINFAKNILIICQFKLTFNIYLNIYQSQPEQQIINGKQPREGEEREQVFQYLIFIIINIMLQQGDKHLLQIQLAKENTEMQEVKTRLSQFSKYFFNIRKNIIIVYQQALIYIIQYDYFKIIDLGKGYLITDLAYNYKKNAFLFLTTDNQLWAYFATPKVMQKVKRDFKKIFLFQWIYSENQVADFFVAEEGGIHLYKYEQQKKGITIKEVKNLSGKYHCFLYEPITEYLVGFQYGDCETAYIFNFQAQKAKNWFRHGEVDISVTEDQNMKQRIKKTKSFGLEGSMITRELKSKKYSSEDYFIDIHLINNTPYMFFYFANQGKLQITPLVIDNYYKKKLTIKLPSDSIPIFNIVDNMLVVHLKNEKFTFIYDVHNTNFQALVSPFSLTHENPVIKSKIYTGEFIGRRIVFTDGFVCKWKISIPVVYHYLKNEMHVFQFLNKRSQSKIQLLKWMRQNLFGFKLINVSKMWKMIFVKITEGVYDESEIVSIVEIYSNLFYTLSIQPLVNRENLANNLIECIRQALEFNLIIPDELLLLLSQLLIQTNKIELLTYLCHHNIIRFDKKIVTLMFNKAKELNNELLYTTAIDLASQGSQLKDILRLLMKSERLKEGKRFIKSNYDKMQVLDMLEMCKYISNQQLKQEFIIFLKLFISFKYPSMNMTYFQQAEKQLFK